MVGIGTSLTTIRAHELMLPSYIPKPVGPAEAQDSDQGWARLIKMARPGRSFWSDQTRSRARSERDLAKFSGLPALAPVARPIDSAGMFKNNKVLYRTT